MNPTQPTYFVCPCFNLIINSWNRLKLFMEFGKSSNVFRAINERLTYPKYIVLSCFYCICKLGIFFSEVKGIIHYFR